MKSKLLSTAAKMCSLVALLCFVSVLTSCKGKNGIFTATSSGRAYEVLVVVDQDMWMRPSGRALFNVLDSDVPGLPQSERSFRIMYTDPRDYDSTLKLIRNIIIVDIRDIYTKGKMKLARDVYASPQDILTIQAPDEKTFQEYVEKNGQRIIDHLTRAEMNRQIRLLSEKHNDYISNTVQEMFGCDIWLPAELSSSKKGENFFWASTNTATADRNFVIYSYPYTDDNTFTHEFFMHKRDSVMKINIPGAQEGMYMSTDKNFVESKAISVHGKYALESRGLWRVKGDFMGGPFVSHTRLDLVNKRVVTAEIFVYSPDKLKRDLVRGMEASLYSLRLPEELAKDQKPTAEEVMPDEDKAEKQK